MGMFRAISRPGKSSGKARLQRKCVCSGSAMTNERNGGRSQGTSAIAQRAASHLHSAADAPRPKSQLLVPLPHGRIEPRFHHDFGRLHVDSNTKAMEASSPIGAPSKSPASLLQRQANRAVRRNGVAAGLRKVTESTVSRQAAKEAEQPAKKKQKKAARSRLPREQVETYIKANNNASVSTELLLCLIWKESSFDPKTKSRSSSATGLMQVTKPAVQDVNRNTPKGVHFENSDITDPAKIIACGTHYLKQRIKPAGDTKEGLEGYGTGPGYADNILACERCLTDRSAEQADPDACLHATHR